MAETVPVHVLLIHCAAAAAEHIEASLRARLPTNSDVRVMTAEAGEDALDLAAETPIDLAISDLVLPRPGISGPYTLIRLRERFPSVHTILIFLKQRLSLLIVIITSKRSLELVIDLVLNLKRLKHLKVVLLFL